MYFFDGYGYSILLIYFMLYVLNLKMTFMTCKDFYDFYEHSVALSAHKSQKSHVHRWKV